MVEIPLSPNTSYFSQPTTLDNQEYELVFQWNFRAKRWFFTIIMNGKTILQGLPLVSNYPILKRYQGVLKGLPSGALMLIDTRGKGEQPTRDNLGTSVKLYYVPRGSL